MRIRVRPRHMLVFAVRGKSKYKGLYTPQRGSYADHFEVQSLWIAEMGEGCHVAAEGVKIGSKAYVLDVYELEDLTMRLWDDYCHILPKKAVKEIIEEAEHYDGTICANMIHEDSLIGVEDEKDRGSDDPGGHVGDVGARRSEALK